MIAAQSSQPAQQAEIILFRDTFVASPKIIALFERLVKVLFETETEFDEEIFTASSVVLDIILFEIVPANPAPLNAYVQEVMVLLSISKPVVASDSIHPPLE